MLGMRSSSIFPIFLSVLTACAGQPTPAPRYEYEVVSIEEQALQAVEQMPTEFQVRLEDDESVWDRSHLFFRIYTNAGAFEENFDYPNPGTTLRSKDGVQDAYRYEIERRLSAGGYRYLVQCLPSRPSALFCERNAKNVARFLRDGHLELSLFDR